MSHNITLYIKTNESLEKLLSLMFEASLLDIESQDSEIFSGIQTVSGTKEIIDIEGEALILTVRVSNFKIADTDIIETAYGLVDPKRIIISGWGYDEFMFILKGVFALIKQYPDDMVLKYDDYTVILAYRDGKLTIDQREFETNGYFANFNQVFPDLDIPYKVEKLPQEKPY